MIYEVDGRPDRTPPYAQEAEISVLGAMLNDGNAAVQIAGVLQAEHFFREAHRRVYRAMVTLQNRGAVIDPPALISELEDAGELEQAGGMPYIGEMLDAAPPAGANVMHWVEIVIDRAQRRQLIEAASKIIRDAYEPEGMPVSVLVDRAEQLVFACAGSSTSGSVPMREALQETFVRVEELARCPGGITGITTGFADVDHNTGGLQRGDLVLIAGRPSMGKTAFGVTALALAAAAAGHGVLVNSLEMSRLQIMARFLCHEALVDIMHLLRGRLEDDDYGRLAQAAGHINSLPIRIHEGLYTVAALRSETRRVAAEFEREGKKLGLVIVDYIGQMDAEGETQNLRVGAISKGLKRLAREADVAMVALSQLSRAPEQRSEHRPQLSDLRDSGNLEQDADVVGFLHRPEYYLTPDVAQEKGLVGRAEFIIGKQRNGPTGPVELYFRKECARFESFEQRESDTSGWGVPVPPQNGRRHARR